MFFKNQLNVYVNLPLTVDFMSIDGITKVVHLMPEKTDFDDWYIVYFEPEDFDKVESALKTHPGIADCERIPMRTHCF